MQLLAAAPLHCAVFITTRMCAGRSEARDSTTPRRGGCGRALTVGFFQWKSTCASLHGRFQSRSVRTQASYGTGLDVWHWLSPPPEAMNTPALSSKSAICASPQSQLRSTTRVPADRMAVRLLSSYRACAAAAEPRDWEERGQPVRVHGVHLLPDGCAGRHMVCPNRRQQAGQRRNAQRPRSRHHRTKIGAYLRSIGPNGNSQSCSLTASLFITQCTLLDSASGDDGDARCKTMGEAAGSTGDVGLPRRAALVAGEGGRQTALHHHEGGLLSRRARGSYRVPVHAAKPLQKPAAGWNAEGTYSGLPTSVATLAHGSTRGIE